MRCRLVELQVPKTAKMQRYLQSLRATQHLPNITKSAKKSRLGVSGASALSRARRRAGHSSSVHFRTSSCELCKAVQRHRPKQSRSSCSYHVLGPCERNLASGKRSLLPNPN